MPNTLVYAVKQCISVSINTISIVILAYVISRYNYMSWHISLYWYIMAALPTMLDNCNDFTLFNLFWFCSFCLSCFTASAYVMMLLSSCDVGNHESINMNQMYGFEGEVKAKYPFSINVLTHAHVCIYYDMYVTVYQGWK